MDNEEIKKYDFSELEPSNVANMIGSLYDLGDEATEIIADKLPAMQEAQSYVEALAAYAINLANENKELSNKILGLREANVKLTMQQIKREPVKTGEEKTTEDLNEALKDLEVYDED